MDDEALYKNPRDNFPERIVAGVEEQIKNQRAKPMGVRVGVSEVQHHRIQ